MLGRGGEDARVGALVELKICKYIYVSGFNIRLMTLITDSLNLQCTSYVQILKR